MMRVATIGGGNAHAITLRALKQLKSEGLPLCITALVSVADSGGSSGRLRKEFGILPPGDLLRASMALSAYEFDELRNFFYEQRFARGNTQAEGHNAGNLLITMLCNLTGSMEGALEELHALWQLEGTVAPITLDQVELCAELENGTVVRGETNIDLPAYDPRIKKTRVWLEPEGSLLRAARAAIESAQYIILGPGDTFTSILPGLLMDETQTAIARSKARLIFITSLANRVRGEAWNFTAADHVRTLQEYLPRAIDTVLAHNAPHPKHPEAYPAKGWQWMEQNAEDTGIPMVQGDIEHEETAGMDYAKLAPLLRKILI